MKRRVKTNRRRRSRLEQLGRTVQLAVDGNAHAAVWLLQAIDLQAALSLIEAGQERRASFH